MVVQFLWVAQGLGIGMEVEFWYHPTVMRAGRCIPPKSIARQEHMNANKLGGATGMGWCGHVRIKLGLAGFLFRLLTGAEAFPSIQAKSGQAIQVDPILI